MKNLTIAIPSYNHGEYIGQLLSILEQVDSSLFELIIVDDYSSDNTKDILTNYAIGKDNVKLHFKKRNAGLVDSLGFILDESRTEYIFIIASDDLIDVDGLNKALDFLHKKPSSELCIFGAKNIFPIGDVTDVYSHKHKAFFNLDIDVLCSEIFFNHPAPILLQSTIFKTQFLRDISAFDGGLKFDDYPVFIKSFMMIKKSGAKFTFLPEINISYYRHHESNTYKNYNLMFLMFKQVYELLAPEHLKVKSIAIVWFMYFTKSLLEAKWSTMLSILKMFNVKYVLHFHSFVFHKVIKR